MTISLALAFRVCHCAHVPRRRTRVPPRAPDGAPKYLAAGRDLRDRYLEEVNTGPYAAEREREV